MNEILQCVPIEEQIRKKERAQIKLRDFLLLLSMNLDNPNFGFWIAYDDNNNVVGYMVLFLVPIPGMKSITIQRIWYKQGETEIIKEFERIIKKWARDNSINKVNITVTRPRLEALKRRWGFKVVSVNMERRIY
jgi:hypothetical protein